MKGYFSLALLLLCSMVAQADAALITGLFNTGVDGSGNELATNGAIDPHYTLNGGNAYVRVPPFGAWTDDGVSQ